MAKKVFISRQIPDNGFQMLKEKGYEIDVSGKTRPLSQKELIKFLRRKPYDAVISLITDHIDGKVFDAVPTAKIFANYAVGFNNFNIADAKKRGVVVTNTPGNFSYCVAEHVMALILGLTTRSVEGDAFVRKGKYKGWSPMLFMGSDLNGKVGSVGLFLSYSLY